MYMLFARNKVPGANKARNPGRRAAAPRRSGREVKTCDWLPARRQRAAVGDRMARCRPSNSHRPSRATWPVPPSRWTRAPCAPRSTPPFSPPRPEELRAGRARRGAQACGRVRQRADDREPHSARHFAAPDRQGDGAPGPDRRLDDGCANALGWHAQRPVRGAADAPADWRLGKPPFPGRAGHAVPGRRRTTAPGMRPCAWATSASSSGRASTAAPSWREVAAPAFPPKPADGPWKDDPTPWSVDLIWGLEAAPDGRLWAGCMPAGLFTSADGGAPGNWSRACGTVPSARSGSAAATTTRASIRSWWTRAIPRTSPSPSPAAASGRPAMAVPAGRTPRKAWSRSSCRPSGAKTRTSRIRTGSTSACAHPDVLWCQHHGGIFRSVDGGLQWEAVAHPQPSGFGFAVAAHPTDPQRAWFVPAHSDAQRMAPDGRMVVTETRDGGATFSVHGGGAAAARCLSPDLPACAGGQRRRPDAGHGLDHRRPVDQRGCGRRAGTACRATCRRSRCCASPEPAARPSPRTSSRRPRRRRATLPCAWCSTIRPLAWTMELSTPEPWLPVVRTCKEPSARGGDAAALVFGAAGLLADRLLRCAPSAAAAARPCNPSCAAGPGARRPGRSPSRPPGCPAGRTGWPDRCGPRPSAARGAWRSSRTPRRPASSSSPWCSRPRPR